MTFLIILIIVVGIILLIKYQRKKLFQRLSHEVSQELLDFIKGNTKNQSDEEILRQLSEEIYNIACSMAWKKPYAFTEPSLLRGDLAKNLIKKSKHLALIESIKDCLIRIESNYYIYYTIGRCNVAVCELINTAVSILLEIEKS